MQYWLFKSEPTSYSIDHLAKEPKETTCWDGVRNYQARNFMQNMHIGDLGFFYHSSCKEPGIIGIVKVVATAYPDDSALDPHSKYFDPKASTTNPRWFMVDLKLINKLPNLISLQQLRQQSQLSELKILQKGNRLSITPVTKRHWDIINRL